MFSFSPAGRRRGPSEAWEDEGEQVMQLQDLFPLTFPSRLASQRRTGPFLSPKGRGKIEIVTACKIDCTLETVQITMTLVPICTLS